LTFSLLIGWLVARIGYSPFFICLSVLDIFGAIVLWTLVRERFEPPMPAFPVIPVSPPDAAGQ
jgi:ACS family hexuronate transporter-like MFS transporter